MNEAPKHQTAPGAASRAYLQRELAVREAAEQVRVYAADILRDLDEGRVPSVRGTLDGALKLARDIEVMAAMATLPAMGEG
jgi:hypothetical protein